MAGSRSAHRWKQTIVTCAFPESVRAKPRIAGCQDQIADSLKLQEKNLSSLSNGDETK